MHTLLLDISALYEGTKSEYENRYHLVTKKLNYFEMLSHKSTNYMYYRLNILVEEFNGLGLTQLSKLDVVNKFLRCLLIYNYGHIIFGGVWFE